MDVSKLVSLAFKKCIYDFQLFEIMNKPAINMYSFWKKQQCRKIWHNCLQNTRYQKNNDTDYWKVVNKQIDSFFSIIFMFITLKDFNVVVYREIIQKILIESLSWECEVEGLMKLSKLEFWE